MGAASMAHAAKSKPITSADTCSVSSIFGAGVTVTGCSGYYDKNLNKDSAFSDVKALLETDFGVILGSPWLEKINLDKDSSGSNISFVQAVAGRTIVGVHWGKNDTAFYDLTLSTNFTTFNIVSTNPTRNDGKGGISNVALYATNLAPVPEPETYAMLLAGLCLVGGIAKRRRAQSAG